MNIDFLPSAKSSSGKSALSGDTGCITGKEGPDDSGEGFFAKLSALFKGDVPSESKAEKVQKSDAGAEDESVDGQAVDEVLAEQTKDVAAGEPADGEAAITAAAPDEKESQPQSVDAQKVMGDGDKILSKLKDANQALTKANLDNQAVKSAPDGKELPSYPQVAHPQVAQVAAETAINESLSSGVDQSDDGQKIASDNTGQGADAAKLQCDDVALSDYPEQSALYVQQESGDVKTAQELSSSSYSSATSAGVREENLDDKDTGSVAAGENPLLATSAAEAESTVSDKGQVSATEGQQDDITRIMSAGAQSSAAAKTAVDPELQSDRQSVTSSAGLASGATAVIGMGQSLDKVADPAQVSLSSVQADATGQTIPDDEALAKAMLEAEGIKAATHESKLLRHSHQSIPNPVQQPLNVAAMAERASAPVPTTPGTVDLAAGSASAAEPVTAATIGAASLLSDINSPSKASWSAARSEAGAAAALETDKARNGRESAFAEQLSSLSGIQTQHNQLSRLESAQNQMPVMVTKDVAADQLAERVQVMLSKNLKNIDIRLDPPELGRMHIRMNMNGDAATVHFTVANQHARDALEGSMPRLREMLAQQGVQLGDTAVQQQGANQQQGYAAGGRAQSQSGSNVGGESGLHDENFDSDVKLNLNVGVKRDGISYYA